jgi:hypothetical protein
MTDPNAVCRAPVRTAARLVARLFCTRPDPVARARSLPFNACVSRRKAQACLQADQCAKATGAEQQSLQARPATPPLAPSTPTRTLMTSVRACGLLLS